MKYGLKHSNIITWIRVYYQLIGILVKNVINELQSIH